MKTILLVAGGTGGHFFPAIALKEYLIMHGYNVIIYTDQRCKKYIDSNSDNSYKIFNIYRPIKTPIKYFIYILNNFSILFKSIYHQLKQKPDLTIGFGGYTMIPHIIASNFLRIPYLLHEQNSIMGKANLFLSNKAKFIMTSFENTQKTTKFIEKIRYTGNIVRKNLFQAIDSKAKEDNSKKYKKILIIGGSQGAKIFSDIIPGTIRRIINENPDIKIQLTQQADRNDNIRLKSIYHKLNIKYEISEFFHNINLKYHDSDIIISRAGASSISEIITLRKASILIPLKNSVDNHQKLNAEFLSNNNASLMVLEDENLKENLYNSLSSLLNNDDDVFDNIKLSISKLKTSNINYILSLINEVI